MFLLLLALLLSLDLKCSTFPLNGTLNNNSTTVALIEVPWGEFLQSTLSNDYDYPTRSQHLTFTRQLAHSGLNIKQEVAMFLAQCIWESGGLQYTKEIACRETGCPGQYDHSVGVPGRNYYGRGFIQLTHSYNYKAASQDLFGDLRLIENPDLVSDDEDIAWRTAFWFWRTRCHPREGVRKGWFGDSTKAINGLECMGSWDPRPKKRFEIYKKVLVALNLENVAPIENGCYS